MILQFTSIIGTSIMGIASITKYFEKNYSLYLCKREWNVG